MTTTISLVTRDTFCGWDRLEAVCRRLNFIISSYRDDGAGRMVISLTSTVRLGAGQARRALEAFKDSGYRSCSIRS